MEKTRVLKSGNLLWQRESLHGLKLRDMLHQGALLAEKLFLSAKTQRFFRQLPSYSITE